MLNRRSFFLSGAAMAAFAQGPKLRLGLIGCGWYGGVDAEAAYKCGGVEFVGIADADTRFLDETSAMMASKQGSKPKTTKDYRELLSMQGLDGVIIATPPHWHALPFIAACEKKLPVYMEKPLAYDVREGRAMVSVWKKAGNAVQVGFQRRQSEAVRQAREYVQSGGAGRIVQVDVQIHYGAQPLDNAPQAPPSTLDWELWLGPAPKMPYSPNVGHKAWRLEESIGNGHLVDWGIHLIDATRWILGESSPLSVSAAGGLYEFKGKITTPDSLTAHFEFAKCPVVWRHRLWGSAEYAPAASNGIFFYGDKETVFVTDQRWEVIPRGKGERRVTEIKPSTDMGRRHMQEWLDAVRGTGKPSCLVDDAYLSTSAVQLGMIAYKSGRTLQWDAKAERIGNDAAANRLLMRPYRAPYKHPYA
jgi:predicted dehydrogenase